MLDAKIASTGGDLYTLVGIKLKRVRDSIYGMRPPRSLRRVTGSALTIPATLTYLGITEAGVDANRPGWNLTDYWKLFGLSIQAVGETRYYEWDGPVDFDTWTRQYSAIAGNQNLAQTYTIDYQNRLYLSDTPTGSDTWSALLHYYSTPPAIISGNSPEVDVQFHHMFSLGTVIQFPNYFRGEERQALLGLYTQEYQSALKEYLRDTPAFKSRWRRRPFVKRIESTKTINWGTGETS